MARTGQGCTQLLPLGDVLLVHVHGVVPFYCVAPAHLAAANPGSVGFPWAGWFFFFNQFCRGGCLRESNCMISVLVWQNHVLQEFASTSAVTPYKKTVVRTK